MGRRKNFNYSLGQLSLFDSSVCGEDTSSASSPTPLLHSQTKQPSGLVKETATAYKVTTKVDSSFQVATAIEQLPQISVYVGITFNECQGMREVKQRWKINPVPSKVVFDCRAIELATEYACEARLTELLEPEEIYLQETYLRGGGGLLNIGVFVNLLRCYGTLHKWSRDMHKATGTKPIIDFEFIPPDVNTPVGQLWKVLGMHGLTQKIPKNEWIDVMDFQSRIVTPLLMANKSNRKPVLHYVQEWLDFISDRIDNKTHNKLWQLVCEVVKNLIDHGHRGVFGVSIWPSGHIEIIWSNPIDHLSDWWPPDDNAVGLANSLLGSQGGGMPCIYDLLHLYQGVLIINWKTHHLIFRSSGKNEEEKNLFNKPPSFSIMGLQPRSEAFLPRSILFHLHLFDQEKRNRSSNNASY
ncbi:hypothetical protein LC607_15100 [Nostoc sp. CHAB 5824]|nr:hypothetical protein [Nostoc sp. CHAB 5824]